MTLTRSFVNGVIAAMFVVAAFFLGSVSAGAQDQTPTPNATPTGGGMTAAIHQGSCQKPDEKPIADLGTFGQPTDSDGKIIPAQGTLTSPPLLQAAASGLDLNLKDTLSSGTPYVIIVHQSAEQFSTYLACGELAGPLQESTLSVALRPVNNAGFAGVAVLSGSGDKTDSTVYLITDLLTLSGGNTSGTPQAAATPIAAQATFAPTTPPTPGPTLTAAPPTAPPTNTPAPATETPTATNTPAPPTETPTPADTATPAPVVVTTTPATVEVTPTPAK